MKIIIAAMTLSLLFAGVALAEETIVLPSKEAGDVPFTHKKHQESLRSCEPCHTTASGGKIEGLTKETAHKLCKDCHVQREVGPIKCSECHKKN